MRAIKRHTPDQALRATLVAATVGALTATSCAPATPAAGSTEVVPIAAQSGRFVWHDLVTRDAAVSQKFYNALLGWAFEATTRDGSTYYLARSGPDFVGGIVERKANTAGPAAWLSYLAVPDLERAVAHVTAAGGTVLVEPRAVGDYGRIAVVIDPQGAPLGLATVTEKVRADSAQPQPNQFFWMEYLATDTPAALAFYKGLAGFESAVTTSPSGDYHVLGTARPRAGLLEIPPAATMIKPNWLPYVRVADPAALAARVEALGGKVLIAPRPELRNGTLAVIADPTGGAIALQKWPMVSRTGEGP